MQDRRPLRVISERSHDKHELLKLFFQINDDKNQTVHVDARGASGNTPLHVALKENNEKVHFIGNSYWNSSDCHELAETFFRINAELDRPVCIDPRDELGNTPLHGALFWGHKRLSELLLRRDADPTLTNDEGLRPLRIICKREDKDDGLIERFLEVIDDMGKTVRVDARDDSGYTPLQWAVANFLPDTVDARSWIVAPISRASLFPLRVDSTPIRKRAAAFRFRIN
ncbi:hypothetical protein TKK_0004057 [Trichogramma kaykai]|uniref:Uncharacterized protein n=1 Tax=Trichogramma kaykai TaxID=54128 RepID=A0ABD2XQ19_9HYME